MIEHSNFQFAIFDCDGVILDSNKVKSEAFALALPDEDPVLVKEFVAYHQKNGGISRYVKFEYFFKTLKNQINYSQAMEAALQRYAALSKEGLISCNEIAGIRNILTLMKEKAIPCYVVSGGDQQEVQAVFEQRGLSPYFSKILGSPVSKIQNLDKLNRQKKLKGRGVFFGDARSDMLAALEYNLTFVFVSGVSEWGEGLKVAKDEGFTVINDFSNIKSFS